MKILLVLLQFILLLGLTGAVSVDSVTVDTVSPGQEGVIKINIENDGNNDVELLYFSLEFPNNSGIIPIGSSEAFVNELKEDDDETFAFRFRVSNQLPAGTYTLPYKINYEESNDEKEQKGVMGIVVYAEPEIEIIVNAENPVIGQQATLNIRAVNKGLADARFVSLSVDSEDITFISEKSEYIGTIDSDDFEVSSFDVIYHNTRPNLAVRLEYKDFGNNDQMTERDISLRAYTREEALDLGLISKSNTATYLLIILGILIAWYILRRVRRNHKKQKKREAAGR